MLQSGDMLYLPPAVKHDGVALDACFTYSIGFRAPSGTELAAAFLDWLHRRGLPEASYRDPRLLPGGHAAAIPATMIDFAERALARIRWTRADVERFLGGYLTEPKPHVVFERRSARRARKGLIARLDPKTQLLYAGRRFFLNGEEMRADPAQRNVLRELADRRRIDAATIAAAGLAGLIYEWQRDGYVILEPE